MSSQFIGMNQFYMGNPRNLDSRGFEQIRREEKGSFISMSHYQDSESTKHSNSKVYTTKPTPDNQQSTFPRSNLRYHKRNKSEPLSNAFVNQLKSKATEYVNTEAAGDHSRKASESSGLDYQLQHIPHGIRDKNSVKPQRNEFDFPAERFASNMNDIKKQRLQFDDREMDKENISSNYPEFRFEREAVAQNRPPIGIRSQQQPLAPPNLRKEKSRENLSNNIEEFFPHKRMNHYNHDTPCFSSSKLTSTQDHQAVHNGKLNMHAYSQNISPVKEDNLTDGLELTMTGTHNGRLSHNPGAVKQDPSLLLNISEIQCPEKSPNKVNLSGSVCLFDDNTSFQSFMNMNENYTQLHGNTAMSLFGTLSSNNTTQIKADNREEATKHQARPQHVRPASLQWRQPSSHASMRTQQQQPKYFNETPTPSYENRSNISNPGLANSTTRDSYNPGATRIEHKVPSSHQPKVKEFTPSGARESEHVQYSSSKSSNKKNFHSRTRSQSKILHKKKKSFTEDMPGKYLWSQNPYRGSNENVSYFVKDTNCCASSEEDPPKKLKVPEVKPSILLRHPSSRNSYGSQHVVVKQNFNKIRNENEKAPLPSNHTRSLSYPDRPTEGASKRNLMIKTDSQPKDTSNIFSQTKVSRYGPNTYLTLKENYKNSVRQRDRGSYEDTQICKNSLSRIASQPEELSRFSESLARANPEPKQEETNKSSMMMPDFSLSAIQRQDTSFTKPENFAGIFQRNSYEPKEQIELSNISRNSIRKLESFYPDEDEEHFLKVPSDKKSAEVWEGKYFNGDSDQVQTRKFNGGYNFGNTWNLTGSVDDQNKNSNNNLKINENSTNQENLKTYPSMSSVHAAELERKEKLMQAHKKIEEQKMKLELKIKKEEEARKKKIEEDKKAKKLAETKIKPKLEKQPSQPAKTTKEPIKPTTAPKIVKQEPPQQIIPKSIENLESERLDYHATNSNDVSKHIQGSQIHFYDTDSNANVESKQRLITDPIENYQYNANDAYKSEEDKEDSKPNSVMEIGLDNQNSVRYDYNNNDENSHIFHAEKPQIGKLVQHEDDEEQAREEVEENYFNYESSPNVNAERREEKEEFISFHPPENKVEVKRVKDSAQEIHKSSSRSMRDEQSARSVTSEQEVRKEQSRQSLVQVQERPGTTVSQHLTRKPFLQEPKSNGRKLEFESPKENTMAINQSKQDPFKMSHADSLQGPSLSINHQQQHSLQNKQRESTPLTTEFNVHNTDTQNIRPTNHVNPMERPTEKAQLQDNRSRDFTERQAKQRVEEPQVAPADFTHKRVEPDAQRGNQQGFMDKDKALLKMEIDSQIKKLMKEKKQQQKEQEESRMKMKQNVLSQLYNWEEKRGNISSNNQEPQVDNRDYSLLQEKINDGRNRSPERQSIQSQINWNQIDEPRQIQRNIETPEPYNQSSQKQSFGLYSSPEPQFVPSNRSQSHYQNVDSEALSDIDQFKSSQHISDEKYNKSQRESQRNMYLSPEQIAPDSSMRQARSNEHPQEYFDTFGEVIRPQYQPYSDVSRNSHSEAMESDKKSGDFGFVGQDTEYNDESPNHDSQNVSPNAQVNMSRQSRSNLDEIHEVDSYESSPNVLSNFQGRTEKGNIARNLNEEAYSNRTQQSSRSVVENPQQRLMARHQPSSFSTNMNEGNYVRQDDRSKMRPSHNDLPENFSSPNYSMSNTRPNQHQQQQQQSQQQARRHPSGQLGGENIYRDQQESQSSGRYSSSRLDEQNLQQRPEYGTKKSNRDTGAFAYQNYEQDDQNDQDPIKDDAFEEDEVVTEVEYKSDNETTPRSESIYKESPNRDIQGRQGNPIRKTWDRQNQHNQESPEPVSEQNLSSVKQQQQPEEARAPKMMVFGNYEDDEDKEKKQRQLDRFIKRKEEERQQVKERRQMSRERSVEKARQAQDTDNNSSDNAQEKPYIVNKSARSPKYSEQPKATAQFAGALNNVASPNQRNFSDKISKKKADPVLDRRDSTEENKMGDVSAKSSKTPSSKQTPLHKPPLNPNQKNLIAYKPTNKQLIKNAMTNVCLSGEFNKKDREAIFQKIDEIKADNFIILFKGSTGRQDFRGLYSYDSNTSDVRRVCATAAVPPALDPTMIHSFYRYDSGAKEFKEIPGNKTFSIAVDAVSLHPNILKQHTNVNIK